MILFELILDNNITMQHFFEFKCDFFHMTLFNFYLINNLLIFKKLTLINYIEKILKLTLLFLILPVFVSEINFKKSRKF